MIKMEVVLENDIWRRRQDRQVESHNSYLPKEARNLSTRQTEKQLRVPKINNKQSNKKKPHSQCSGFNNKYKGTMTDTCFHVAEHVTGQWLTCWKLVVNLVKTLMSYLLFILCVRVHVFQSGVTAQPRMTWTSSLCLPVLGLWAFATPPGFMQC